MLVDDKGADDSGKQSDAGAKEISFKVGEVEHKLNADQVAALVLEQKSVTERGQRVAPLLKALEKYETDPETFLEQSEESWALIGQLQAAGMIDNKGNIVKTDQKVVTTVADNKDKKFTFQAGDDKTLAIVEKALGPKLDEVLKKLKGLEDDQNTVFREMTKTKILAKYPTFSEEDVSKLFVKAAQANSKKGLWDLAEEMSGELKTKGQTTREAYAKEFGVDLKAFDENKLHQQDADGGAAAIFKGKKFSFGRGPKGLGKDGVAITPRQATVEFFKKVGGK